MRLNFEEIAQACAGRIVNADACDAQRMVTGLTWDSRKVASGDVYVALPGARVDGHAFAEGALRDGAAAVLVQQDVDDAVLQLARTCGAAIIQVESTYASVEALARFWRTRLQGRVIALTGSTGKTTTKNLVRDVLSRSFSVVATQGNQNNELGVPATLLRAEADTQAVVVEMGMRGAGQITKLCAYVHPDWGIVNNVGDAHIELLGSRDAIARAKGELFCGLPDGAGVAFANAADDYCDFLLNHAALQQRGVEAVSFGGRMPGCARAVWAEDVQLDGQGCPSFTLMAAGFGTPGAPSAPGTPDQLQSRPCTLSLRGIHNVSNACVAAAVGLMMGMSIDDVAAALQVAQPELGRQEILQTSDGITLINDAYNANPDSMHASLQMFSSMAVEGRRIAVLGDMLELGDFAPQLHERVGGYAAESAVDRLVCVGDLARHIAQGALQCGLPAERITCVAAVDDALALVRGEVRTGDAVLAKASNSMDLNRIIKGLLE